jgi:predicted small secreted protein
MEKYECGSPESIDKVQNVQYELYNNCLVSLNTLFDLYKNNDYMLQRIHTQIVNYLPNTLKNELTNHEKRVSRAHFLTSEQQVFIQVFLSKNKYFYLPNNGFFYEYDDKNYFIVKEDDIIHKLLSSISKDRVLLDWKHKTKINVIKLIKERNLLNSIPETDTIQNVLNIIYPSLFASKNQAKYFLTIIGDNIFKKNQRLNFFISLNMKKLLTELENISYLSIGNTNITNNFVTKYHENHEYEDYRLIKINDNFSLDLWKEQLKKIGLDLLCVSTHYSKRYENSEKFLENKCDEDFMNFALYLKSNTQQQIISKFGNTFLNKVDDKESIIQWKNLHFIWKQFLSMNHLPNMIYSNTLKNILKEIYDYDEDGDYFTNLTSKYLPIESDFIKFWEKTINITSDNIDSFDELEIDELCMLFKLWVQNNNGIVEEKLISNGNISEENVLKILKHFFPHIEIIENKYILNVKCEVWDKNNEIEKSFHYIKKQIQNSHTLALISFDDAYNYYYKFCYSESNKLIVSKRYFEKYLYSKIPKHIVYEKFIETVWINET